MEGISMGLKKYWRRSIRGYQRVEAWDGRKRETVQLGRRSKRRIRRWRIKMPPKMRIPKLSYPKKFMVWVRDAYVRMMLGMATSMGASAVGYRGDGASSTAKGVFERAPPPKEYDQKMLIHIYKSLIIAQGHLLSPDPTTPKPPAPMLTTF